MTDYLEPLVQNGADALREAERRMARALDGLSGDGGRPLDGEDSARGRAPFGEPEGAALEEGETRRDMETGRWDGRLILEEELSAVGRAMDGAAGPARREARAAEVDGLARRDGGRWTGDGDSGMAGITGLRGGWGTGAEPPPGGFGRIEVRAGDRDQDWAEAVDRAFQRDSRRYDGGFFLY